MTEKEKQLYNIIKLYIASEYHEEISVSVDEDIENNKIFIDTNPISDTQITCEILLDERDDFVELYEKLLDNFDLSFNLEFSRAERRAEIEAFIK